MKDLQLTIYDMFSILLPAALVLTLFHMLTGVFHSDLITNLDHTLFPVVNNNSNTAAVNFPTLAGYTILFVVTYALGQAIHMLGKFVEEMPGVKTLLTWNPKYIFFDRPDSAKYTTFFTKVVGVTYKKEIAERILTKLTQIYHTSFSPDDDLTDVLIQPLSGSAVLTKRDTFLANACMMRNLAVVALGFVLYFAVSFATGDGSRAAIGYAFLAFVMFRYGYQKYKSYEERLLLSAFLVADTINMHVPTPTVVEQRIVS